MNQASHQRPRFNRKSHWTEVKGQWNFEAQICDYAISPIADEARSEIRSVKEKRSRPDDFMNADLMNLKSGFMVRSGFPM